MGGVLRAVFGIAAASVAPALVAAIIQAAFDPYASVPTVSTTFVAATVVAAGHALILGLPKELWLRHSGTFRLRSLILVGFVVGALPTLVLQAFPLLLRVLQRSTEPAILPGLLAVGAAGIFGCIGAISFFAVCRRQWSPSTEQQGAPGPQLRH